MRPQNTVFVDRNGTKPVVFVWKDDLESFIRDPEWTVVGEGSDTPHEQPFTIEGWFDQPCNVIGLDGKWYLVNNFANDALFIGAYPGGIVYADRTTRGPGFDYARVAFLPYDTLKLEVQEDADPELVRRAKTDASQYKAGDKFEISATGQYVILGSK